MKKFIIASGALLAPVSAVFAAGGTDATNILNTISGIISTIIPILILAGVAYFIWGVIQYVTAKDEESQGSARKTMISGIIGLFVIVSMWGLVRVIQNTFDVRNDGTQINNADIPCVPGTYDVYGVYCQ